VKLYTKEIKKGNTDFYSNFILKTQNVRSSTKIKVRLFYRIALSSRLFSA
jgi:hypothetical protein